MTNINEKERTTGGLASEKILDRVRKLLAMSSDTSSPNEAAIAAKRARKLIDQYQLHNIDFSKVQDTDLGETYYETNRSYNKVLGVISVAIAQLNDCQAILSGRREKTHYVFQGMLADTTTCVEMMIYLRAEMYFQKEEVKGRRNKNAFEMGFATGIANQVKEILKERSEQKIQATGKSLVVVKQDLVRRKFGNPRYGRTSHNYGQENAFSKGKVAGQNTSLNRQVSGGPSGYLN